MAPLRKLFIFTTQLVSGLYRLFDHPTEIKDYFEKNNITNGQILLNSRGEILGSVGDRRFASKDTAPPYTADRRFASKDTAKPYRRPIGDRPRTSFALIWREAPNNSIISFRGSETFIDWMHDFDIKQSDYYVGKVSTGFLIEYQAVRSKIEKIKFGSRTVITGHSLGAALAILCAVHIYIEFGIQPTVYLFASPRVGNIEFANWYDQHIPNTYMFYLAGDIAPNFPSVNMGCYKHVAYPHYILNYDPVSCSLHAYHSMDNFLLTDEWFKHIHTKVNPENPYSGCKRVADRS